jgi:hypothetical protein
MLKKFFDNTSINSPKSRYCTLLRMALQWRHLKMLKRGGRAHDPTGVAGTQEGELAVLCPSCPHARINIPTDWEDVSEDKKYLYACILCMDTNFWLKNQLISSFSSDPGLGIGMVYMVTQGPFDRYVLSQTSDCDIGKVLFPTDIVADSQ